MHVHTEGKEALVPGMRKIGWLALAATLLTSACARQMVSTESSLPGAAVPSAGAAPSTVGGVSGRSTVEAFLAAVNAQDLQAMSGLWGNSKGLARDQLKREELEKRLIIMQCLMQHEKAVFPEERPRLQTGGRQEFIVTLSKGKNTANTAITTVQGPSGRWLVEDVDVTKLRDFCR
ncbi:hypothetical protein [Gemmatimonas sp.]